MTFKIMIADKDPDSRISIKKAVNAAVKDCLITITDSAVQAQEEARSQDFDLILIDLQYSDPEQTESLKVIHMSEPDLPIIAISASAESDEKEEILKSGANLLIEKPVDANELVMAVKKMIGIQE